MIVIIFIILIFIFVILFSALAGKKWKFYISKKALEKERERLERERLERERLERERLERERLELEQKQERERQERERKRKRKSERHLRRLKNLVEQEKHLKKCLKQEPERYQRRLENLQKKKQSVQQRRKRLEEELEILFKFFGNLINQWSIINNRENLERDEYVIQYNNVLKNIYNSHSTIQKMFNTFDELFYTWSMFVNKFNQTLNIIFLTAYKQRSDWFAKEIEEQKLEAEISEEQKLEDWFAKEISKDQKLAEEHFIIEKFYSNLDFTFIEVEVVKNFWKKYLKRQQKLFEERGKVVEIGQNQLVFTQRKKNDDTYHITSQ